MTFSEFKKTLAQKSVPEKLSDLLKALWFEAQGDWDKAHKIVQNMSSAKAANIHAYLHRKEGDDNNALYWYSNAGESFYHGSFADEWNELVQKFLK
ncbi:MAG: hypothetical protein KDF60_14515 [Calditrichaeota bacterium]|nr:hypothetical protein [Calditrichota bacterium]